VGRQLGRALRAEALWRGDCHIWLPETRPRAVHAVYPRCRSRQRCAAVLPGARCPTAEERVTAWPDTAHDTGVAPPATVLRIARLAIDSGGLCRPGGPDGEGQAEGPALSARGKPMLLFDYTRAGI